MKFPSDGVTPGVEPTHPDDSAASREPSPSSQTVSGADNMAVTGFSR